ncbi:hypothetical protein NC652_029582 [Populus alba x Populus x berolinensis]|nr:hypothetical protein NC652_029582 [Populus alba x Populus x berolinensis]
MMMECALSSNGNGDFTKAIGWARSEVKEACIIDEDGVVKVFNSEEGGAFTFSGADDMLKAL